MAESPKDQTFTLDKNVYTATIKVRDLTLLDPVCVTTADGVAVVIPAGTVLRVSEVV